MCLASGQKPTMVQALNMMPRDSRTHLPPGYTMNDVGIISGPPEQPKTPAGPAGPTVTDTGTAIITTNPDGTVSGVSKNPPSVVNSGVKMPTTTTPRVTRRRTPITNPTRRMPRDFSIARYGSRYGAGQIGDGVARFGYSSGQTTLG